MTENWQSEEKLNKNAGVNIMTDDLTNGTKNSDSVSPGLKDLEQMITK